jgi:hypothetical protein
MKLALYNASVNERTATTIPAALQAPQLPEHAFSPQLAEPEQPQEMEHDVPLPQVHG